MSSVIIIESEVIFLVVYLLFLIVQFSSFFFEVKYIEIVIVSREGLTPVVTVSISIVVPFSC